MKIRGTTTEATTDAAIVRQSQNTLGTSGAQSNAATVATKAKDTQDQVKISKVSNEINSQVSAAQIKSERDIKKAELKAKIDAGDYLVPTDKLTLEFLNGLSEHNSFFRGVEDLFGDDKA